MLGDPFVAPRWNVFGDDEDLVEDTEATLEGPEDCTLTDFEVLVDLEDVE